MAYYIGSVVGGAVAIALLSAILNQFAFKKLPPLARAEWTVGISFAIASALSGFGKADGHGFQWDAWQAYLPGAVAVFLWRYGRYKAAWANEGEAD